MQKCEFLRWSLKHRAALHASLVVFLMSWGPGANAGAVISTFDAPNASYTVGLALNASNSIVGFYLDSSSQHGFLRAPDGTFTTIDPAGSLETLTNGINNDGTIVGCYQDHTSLCHAFLRTSDGNITVFDPPESTQTRTSGISSSGEVAGTYSDSNGEWHGFVRSVDGTITTFDPPNSTEVEVGGINDDGVVAGSCLDSGAGVGYLRKPTGQFVTFAIGGNSNTGVTAVNNIGEVAGFYGAETGQRGFRRGEKGGIKTFKGSRSGQTTTVTGLNDNSDVVGYWQRNGQGYARGFSWKSPRQSKVFLVAGAGTDPDQGTFPAAINSSGSITGWYVDSENHYHGFLRTK